MTDTPVSDSYVHTYGNGVQNWKGQWVPAFASRSIESSKNYYEEQFNLALEKNIELANITYEDKKRIHQLEQSLENAKDKIKEMKISGDELAETAETLYWVDDNYTRISKILIKWRNVVLMKI